MDNSSQNLISVGEVFTLLKSKLTLLIFLPTLVTILGVFYAINLPEIFESKGVYEIRVNKQSDSSGFLSALAGGNITGVLSNSSGSNVVIQSLKSKQNIIKFLILKDCKNNNYLEEVCNSFKQDKLYPSNVINYYLSRQDLEKYEKPYIKFNSSLKISSNEGLITIGYSAKTGQDAYSSLVSYINYINAVENNKKTNELNNSISFAELRLGSGGQNFLREAYSKTLQSFTYELSMLNMQEEYLLKSIDSPLIPVNKIAPNKRLIVILFFIGSLSFTIFFIVLRFFILKL
jgi:LPS O-antigen subunit length determinant protein (WzzB/FepE family)